MKESQRAVLKFHRTFDQHIEVVPRVPSLDVCNLRVGLIQEEFQELIEAMGDQDINATADAIGDLLYVVLGTAVACGFDAQSVFDEVHRSNMTKVGGYKNASGKWIKPSTYKPANIEAVLKPWED